MTENDISFWKNNKSMQGLSFRAMVMNLFFQTVIFLYLCDNDTSWMILFSSGAGLAIEVWKLGKAVKSISVEPLEGSWRPRLTIVPADSYTMSETKVYDEEAMRYLSLAMYPLVVGYSMYSLAYDAHKSWYSWLLGSTVNFVYSFGFVLMTPQLFINYKLKSTAHMPFKTFMYKALNTFIDDLFAFIIRSTSRRHECAHARSCTSFAKVCRQQHGTRDDWRAWWLFSFACVQCQPCIASRVCATTLSSSSISISAGAMASMKSARTSMGRSRPTSLLWMSRPLVQACWVMQLTHQPAMQTCSRV